MYHEANMYLNMIEKYLVEYMNMGSIKFLVYRKVGYIYYITIKT